MKKAIRLSGLTILVAIGAAITLDAARAAVADTEDPLPTIIGGGNRTLSVTIVRPHGAFSVDPQRFRVSLTDVRTHAHVDVKASESRLVASHVETRKWYSIEYRDADMVDLHYPLRANIAASMYSLRFETNDGVRDRAGVPLEVRDRPTPSLIYVPPPRPSGGEDANLLGVRRYIGKKLYGVGAGVGIHCGPGLDVGYSATDPAVVLGVRRKYGSTGTWAVGGTFDTRGFDTEASFLAIDPLEITFRTPRNGFQDASLSISSTQHGDSLIKTFLARAPGTVCPRGTASVSDTWEFERMFSLRHPFRGRGWPAHFRNAVRDGKIIVGMTPVMVAAVWGYPSLYGTAPEMQRLTRWPYILAGPFAHAVRFRDGRVIALNEPSGLP